MQKKITYVLFLILLFLSFNNEIHLLVFQLNNFQQLKLLFMGITFIFCYVLPITLFLKNSSKTTSVINILKFILSGFFMAGSFSYFLIYQIDNFIWKSSSIVLLGPFMEEILKTLVFLFSLYVFNMTNKNNLLDLFILASFLGLGFQIYEDYMYVLTNLDTNSFIFFKLMIERLANSIASHWIYTGIISLGIILFLKKKISNKSSIFLIVSPIILHILWNSYWNNSIFISSILSAITVSIYLFILDNIINYTNYNKID